MQSHSLGSIRMNSRDLLNIYCEVNDEAARLNSQV